MAPAPGSSYFPPLDKCLTGDSPLVSWKTAYLALCHLDSAVEDLALEAFLTGQESITLLAHPIEPFPTPSSRSKSEFETKTAPIHVSQSAHGGYSLAELKGDALWLSKELEIEELVALRVAILELHARPVHRLLGRVTSEEAPAELGPDLGNSLFGASTIAPPPPPPTATEIRHRRLLEQFLEERNYLRECAAALVGLRQAPLGHEEPRNSFLSPILPHSALRRTWLEELPIEVSQQLGGQASIQRASFAIICLENLEKQYVSLADPSKRPKAIQDDDTLDDTYLDSVLRDMLSIMRILLIHLAASDNITDAAVVQAWFKLTETTGYLQDATPITPTATAYLPLLQGLMSILSLTVLKLPQVASHIRENALPHQHNQVSYPKLPQVGYPYIEDDVCVKEVNLILCRAVAQGATLASPAGFAWSIITSMIRDCANLAREAREQRIEDGSSDSEAVGRTAMRGSRARPSQYDRQLDLLQDPELGAWREDPPTELSRMAVDGLGVLGEVERLSGVVGAAWRAGLDVSTAGAARTVLFGLVRESLLVVSYGADTLQATLAVLDLATPTGEGATPIFHFLVARFLDDGDRFRPLILEQALLRYPYELSPLLRLLTALANGSLAPTGDRSAVVKILENLSSFTQEVPYHFAAYRLVNEEDNANSMLLTDDLAIFIPRPSLAAFQQQRHGGSSKLLVGNGDGSTTTTATFAVPAGSAGVILKETRPYVIKFEHSHSGLEYLGLLLSTLLPHSELRTAPPFAELDTPTATEIVTLAKALVASAENSADARFVLDRLGSALPEQLDFVAIVAELFEVELLAHLDQRAAVREGSLELCTACVEFLDVLLQVTPERVWSFLANGSLLGLSGGASSLATIVSGTEGQTGRYDFLARCVEMFSHILDDAVRGLVKRLPKPTPQRGNRFDSPMQVEGVTPERTMSLVLAAFGRIVLDAFLKLGEWAYGAGEERAQITTTILETFTKLLRCAYGVDGDGGKREEKDDDVSKPVPGMRKLTAVLMPAASALLETFVTGIALKPFSAALTVGLHIQEAGLTTQFRLTVAKQTVSALSFLTCLVRTTALVTGRAGRLCEELVKLVHLLAHLFAVERRYKAPVAELLTQLLQAGGIGESGPPSLLGQLSPEAAKHFLVVLTQLDLPLRGAETECVLWEFLAAVMRSRQQWFSMYLLTGSLPKDRLKASGTATKGRTLFAVSLDQLANIAMLNPDRATAMLKFVAQAQKSWAWATNEVRTRSDFVKNALDWMESLQPTPRAANPTAALLSAKEHEMAALLCEVLAVNLQASLEVADKSLLKMVVPKLGFLRDHAAEVKGYNRSLHKNLAENLSNRFPGVELAQFARTAANPARQGYGGEFVYDVGFAEQVLGHERESWRGKGKALGFREEFERANVNLSLIDAQTGLLTSWKGLATTLCECIELDAAALQPVLAGTVKSALAANAEANADEPQTGELLGVRAELAFVVTARLVGVKSKVPEMRRLLEPAWALVRGSPVDFDVAVQEEDLRYYRTLLQILYLAVQPHGYMQPEASTAARQPGRTDTTNEAAILSPTVAPIMVGIVAKCIAPSFRALCANLHGRIHLAQPGDFALLTALLQSILSIHGLSQVHHQIADVIASANTLNGALSLYSWSDQLASLAAGGNDTVPELPDPVYGELAIAFLLSLSTVPAVAEQMALNCALISLSEANLSSYFRKAGGKGPFDPPIRMFTIWTDGFLPLCLNLLDAVGPPIAGEVAGFLNSFPQQLARAEIALQDAQPTPRNPRAGAVTLGLAKEAHNLTLISIILKSDAARAAAEGLNAADIAELECNVAAVREDVEALSKGGQGLKSRVTATNARELELARGEGGGEGGLLRRITTELSNTARIFAD